MKNVAQPTKSPELKQAWVNVNYWCPVWAVDAIHEGINEGVGYSVMKSLTKYFVKNPSENPCGYALKALTALMVFY